MSAGEEEHLLKTFEQLTLSPNKKRPVETLSQKEFKKKYQRKLFYLWFKVFLKRFPLYSSYKVVIFQKKTDLRGEGFSLYLHTADIKIYLNNNKRLIGLKIFNSEDQS